jgi:subtilisin family serine protease
MGREQHSPPKKRLNRLPSIEAKPRSIEQCEQRLALSASLAGDLLLELLDVDSIQDDTDATGPDLIQQSAELRAEQGLDGSGQTVAVIDSGVAWDHVALGGGYGPGYRVVGGWDFAEQDSNPYDDGPAGYHGTHVTGPGVRHYRRLE